MRRSYVSTVKCTLPLSAWLVGFVVALSSIVRIEPAPYDLLVLVLCSLFFLAGLRVPARLGIPLFAMTLLVVANLLSILSAIATNTNSIMPMVVYAALTIYLIVTWFFFTCFIAQSPWTSISAIWNGYLVAAIIASVLGIGGYFGVIPGSDVFSEIGRANGPFKDPNVLAPFLVPPLLYVLVDAIGRPLAAALARYSLALMFGFCILLSFSRGGWLNLGMSVCTYAFLHVLVSKSANEVISFAIKGLFALVLMAGVLTAATLTSPSVQNMLSMRATLFHDYDLEPGGRFDTQISAIRAIWEHPLGVGPGQRAVGQSQDPHNLYIKVALENGWLGGTALLLFVLLTLWRGLRLCTHSFELRRSQMVVMSCLLAVAIQSIFIDTLHWRHFFLLLAMAWGVILSDLTRPAGARDTVFGGGRTGNKNLVYSDASSAWREKRSL